MSVTVCIPAWNGEPFVAETLESVRVQTVDDITVLISVDKSDDRTLEICQGFAERDARFRVFSQDSRLGWVGNVNWLLRRAKSDFANILPHDDVIAPTYLERLLEELEDHPEAVLAYCDIELFGSSEGVRVGPEVTGDLFTRIVRFLSQNTFAEAWRGVFRGEVLERGYYHEQINGAAADQVWLLRLAIQGHLVRHPEVLYRKRLHAASVVVRAFTENGLPKDSHWVDHCVSCRRIALGADQWTTSQRQAIDFAALMRVISRVRVKSDDVMTALLTDLADYTVRLSGMVPLGSDVMSPDDVPEELRSYLASKLRFPWARLD